MPKTGQGTANTQKRKTAGFRSRRQSASAVRQTKAPALPTSTASNSGLSPARSAPPLPKRNKGQLFVGTIFVSVVMLFAYGFWTSYFQYQSYGIVSGRQITVSSPWNGVVLNWRVKEGEEVVQGQPLAEISNLEMRHKLEELLDNLRLNQAQLDAETAKLQFELQGMQTGVKKIQAEFLEKSGTLDAEEVLLKDVSRQLERARKLRRTGNFSQQKYDKLYFEHESQKRKIAKLKLAVEALRNRFDLANSEQEVDRQEQLRPLLAKIETIQSEINRIREKIQQGEILAPVGGRVTKRHLLTGESVQAREPIAQILENNSIEAILYVPQEIVDEFKIENTIQIEVPPFEKGIECKVTRLGDQLESAPKHIGKYYAEDSVLLPIYLKPLPEYEHLLSFRINGIIKLPIEYEKNLIETFADLKNRIQEFFVSDEKSVPPACEGGNAKSKNRLIGLPIKRESSIPLPMGDRSAT